MTSEISFARSNLMTGVVRGSCLEEKGVSRLRLERNSDAFDNVLFGLFPNGCERPKVIHNPVVHTGTVHVRLIRGSKSCLHFPNKSRIVFLYLFNVVIICSFKCRMASVKHLYFTRVNDQKDCKDSNLLIKNRASIANSTCVITKSLHSGVYANLISRVEPKKKAVGSFLLIVPRKRIKDAGRNTKAHTTPMCEPHHLSDNKADNETCPISNQDTGVHDWFRQ